jgi:UDP-GlcNAc:undecaprenyl-phosphate/decaprenyl-phosphate GlcNAc-1-phosphate transferase
VKDYVLTVVVTAAVTYILTPLVRRLAGRVGAMKQPRDRDVHVVPVPTIGGLAMYGGLAAGLLVAYQIPLLRAGLANTGMIPGLLLAGGLLVVIGFIDDRWGMDALPKAAGQIAAGGILVATGTSLSWLPLPGGNTYIPTTDQATVLTILIVVATINAVNFIDGLDGLAAGIVCIAAVSFFVYYYELSKVIHLTVLAAPPLASAILIGMCLGFLPHNFSPATIFMGDTGSMLLGLLLAYAPIASIDSLPEANLTNQLNRYPVILPLLLPAALLVIPYGDMLLAVVRRTRAGRSPFAPDRKHLHHRLLEIGHSQRASVLIMYLWAAAFSGTVVWLSIQKTVKAGNSNHHGAPIAVFVIITVVAVAVLLFLSMPRLRWWQRARLTAPADAGTAGAGVASAGAAELGAGSPVLDSPGLAGPKLVGVTAGPAPSGTVPDGDAPGRRGRLSGALAEPAPQTPPFVTQSFATPSPPTPNLATPPLAVPPSATSTGLPTSGYAAAEPSDGAGVDRAGPDMRRAGPPLAPGIGAVGPALPPTGLASTSLPSTGVRSTWLPSAGLPSTGLPPAGLPSTGRSVIGTPPPAVSGQPPGRPTHRAPVWRPETSQPPAADGNKTEQDGLP